MIADTHICLATLHDAIEIAELSRHEIETGLPWRWTPARVSRSIRDPETNAAIVRERGELAAFGIMKYREEVAHLLLFAVAAQRRRSGLGSALLIWLEAVARTAGIGHICLEAREDNSIARAFYASHGYRETAHIPGMYSSLADGVRLEKFWPATPLLN